MKGVGHGVKSISGGDCPGDQAEDTKEIFHRGENLAMHRGEYSRGESAYEANGKV